MAISPYLKKLREHVGTVRIRGDKSMTLVDVKTDDGTDPNGHSFGLPIRGNVGKYRKLVTALP